MLILEREKGAEESRLGGVGGHQQALPKQSEMRVLCRDPHRSGETRWASHHVLAWVGLVPKTELTFRPLL